MAVEAAHRLKEWSVGGDISAWRTVHRAEPRLTFDLVDIRLGDHLCQRRLLDFSENDLEHLVRALAAELAT